MNENDDDILTRDEVRRIIEADQNPKHRLMLILTYSAGLRAAEIENLRPGDIDFAEDIIHIRDDEHKLERSVSLSKIIMKEIKPYIEIYRPSTWLFPGPDSVSKITEMGIENIFRDAMLKAGIFKESGIGILRRSIAAHLMENGLDKKEINRMLGKE